MIKKIITIVLPIIAVTAAIFIFGLKVYEDSFDKFQYDGYIIGASTGKETAKYHFSKDEKYKVNSSKNEVQFTNNEDEDVVVSDVSFVHYGDGSISTFKKAVVLNLENVKTDSLQYYNIFNGSVFTKTKDGYQIKYLENKLNFSNFIVKISDTKYMIVGKDMKIKYGDKEEIITDGFLEINYLDGNIIRVENQDFLLQNISSDFGINVDDIQLDLLNKKIVYQEETKVNLGEITIDSDDNIEIIPDDENTKIDQDALNKIEELENAPVVTPGSDVSGMESGVVDTTIEKVDEIIQENETIPDPIFKTVLFNVNALSMSATVSVEDNAKTLKGLIEWKVIENATNRIVGENKVTLSGQSFSVEVGNLMPDTNYSLIVTSKYEKNEVTYEKDFLQRTFITKSVGFSIEKDYVSTDLLAFNVIIPSESALSDFTYKIIESADPSTVLQTGTFDRTKNSVTNCDNVGGHNDPSKNKITSCSVAVERNVKANTKYSLVITDIQYLMENGSKEAFADDAGYEVYKTVQTLKQRPIFGSTSVITNKMSSTFQIGLNSVTDPNNSILSYRADIYLSGDEENGKPLTTREASAANKINIQIDGQILQKRTNYVAKIYATYYDNEKEYDVLVGTTPTMNMSSKESATVSFKETYVRHDLIQGEVKISDPDGTIIPDTIKIKVQNASETTESVYTATQDPEINGFETTYRIELNNLRKNSSYIFTVQAQVLLEETINSEPAFTNIGQFVVSTKMPEVQTAWISNLTGKILDSYFTLQFMITPPNVYTNTGTEGLKIEKIAGVSEEKLYKAWHEMKTLSKIEFRLRRDTFTSNKASDCTPSNYCWTFYYEDGIADYEQSNIINNFFPADYNANGGNANVPTFRPSTQTGGLNNALPINLGLPPYNPDTNTGGLPKGTYYLEIVKAIDYTDYDNEIYFENDKYEFYSNAENETDIVSFEETMTETKGVDTGYEIKNKIEISRLKQLEIGGEEYSYSESFEHYLVNITDGEICEIPKDDDITDPTKKHKFVTNNNRNVSLNFEKFNKYYEDLEEETGNDYSKCVLKRGNTYGYYYNYILDINVGTNTETIQYGEQKTYKTFTNENQPIAESPTITAVLNKTVYADSDDEGSQLRYLIDYKIDDPDETLGENPVISYKNPAGGSGYLPIRCGEKYDETEGCIEFDEENQSTGTFGLKNDSTNAMIIQLYADVTQKRGVLNKQIEFYDIVAGEPENRVFNVNEESVMYRFMDSVELKKEYAPAANVDIAYTVDTASIQNTVAYTISSLSNITRKNFVQNFIGAKLTLTGGEGNSVVLYKNFYKNGYDSGAVDAADPQILVSFGEILDLMGQDITTTIELLYDTNYYGYNYSTDANDAPQGVVIQTNDRAYKYEVLNENFNILSSRDSSLNCDEDLLNCELRYKSNDHNDEYYTDKDYEIFNLKNSTKGLYYEPSAGTKKYVMLKKLGAFTSSCGDNSGNCRYRFDAITPTMYMEQGNIEPTFSGVNFKINFSMVHDVLKDEDENSKNFKIIAYYYQDENLTRPMIHNGSSYKKEFELDKLHYDSTTGRYTLTEDNLLTYKDYYVVFKWKNDDTPNENDFFYSSEWHDDNPGVETRVYKFKTLITWENVNSLSLVYQTGTKKRYNSDGTINNSWSSTTDQNPSFSRGLKLTLTTKVESNNVIKGYRMDIRVDANENGQYYDAGDYSWISYNVPISEFKPNGVFRTIDKVFSIDPKEITVQGETAVRNLSTSTKFAILLTPYSDCSVDLREDSYASCNETDHIRTYNTHAYKKTYSISSPTISIVRIENPEDGGYRGLSDVFSLRVIISDKYRTVGQYNYAKSIDDPDFDSTNSEHLEVKEKGRYQLEIYADNEKVHTYYINTSKAEAQVEFTDIEFCRNAQSCRVELNYSTDTLNAGLGREPQSKQKQINIAYNYDIGSINRGSVNKDNIYINFKNGLNITSVITRYDITIESDSYSPINIINEPVIINTNAAGTTDTLKVDLKKYGYYLRENVDYTVNLKLKTEDEYVLEEWTAEGVSYSNN